MVLGMALLETLEEVQVDQGQKYMKVYHEGKEFTIEGI